MMTAEQYVTVTCASPAVQALSVRQDILYLILLFCSSSLPLYDT